MLLVSRILENAADVAPDAVAATLDDESAHLRRDRTGRQPDRARHCSHTGIGRGDRVLWWGDTSLDGDPDLRGLREGRRGVRAAERAGVARGGAPGRGATRGRRSCSAGMPMRMTTSTIAPGSSLTASASPTASTGRTTSRARGRGPTWTSTSAIRTSSSSPAAAPAGPRASCCRTAPTGCGRSSARPAPRAAAAPCACSRCSTWPDGRSRSVRGRPADPCTSSGSPMPPTLLETTARHHAARLYCIPAVWGRILEHGVAGYDLIDVGRGRHRDVRDATGAPGRDQGGSAQHRDARASTDRPRPGRRSHSATRDLFRKPGSVGVAQPSVEVRLDTTRRGVRAQPVPHGRVLRRSRRDRRGARRRLVPHGRPRRARRRRVRVDRRPGARRDPHRRRDGRATRGRGSGRRRIPTWPRSRWSAFPTREWGEVVTAVIVHAPRLARQ